MSKKRFSFLKRILWVIILGSTSLVAQVESFYKMVDHLTSKSVPRINSEELISKNKFSYLGMIGSAIKGKKFRDRFINKGYQQEVVDKFTCPIGEKQKFLKSPTSIAVTIEHDFNKFFEDIIIEF